MKTKERAMRWCGKVTLYSILTVGTCSVAAENFPSNLTPPLSLTSKESRTDVVLQELIQILDQETALATKTKLNIDFVPGIMTVLRGKDLQARGIQNVYEALALVPGVELSRANNGQPQILVRGIGISFFSSKVKFLLNNVPFNATLGAATNLLVLPIEQVQRIEVIRGPGSAVYGEFASMGVINIISKQTENAVFAKTSYQRKIGYGGSFSKKIPKKMFSLSVNFARLEADGGDVTVDKDIFYDTPQQDISNSPGPINNKQQHQSLILDVNYQDYGFTLQHVEQGLGDYYGLANALPTDKQRIVRKIIVQSLTLSKTWRISKDWLSKWVIGKLDYELDSEPHELYPPGFLGQFPEGVLGAPNYQDDKVYFGAEFNFYGWKNHNWLLGVKISRLEQGETFVERNYIPQDPLLAPNAAPPTLIRYTGSDNWLAENLDRQVISFYMQDEFSYSDAIRFTLGARFDDYDDVGSDVMPRVAAVYQLTDSQTAKIQYAQSFRPPTFLEMFTQNNPIVKGNPNLSSENVDTVELGYVYHNGATIFRSTLFYFHVKDLIVIEDKRYVNEGNIKTHGLEVELQYQIDHKTKIDATLTSLNVEDQSTGARVPGVANLLANFAFLLQPQPNFAITLQLISVGDRGREAGDSRFDLDGYNVINLSASVIDVGVRTLNIHFGIKNLFDNDVLYPAPLISSPAGGSQRPAYENDYLQSGRELFFKVSYNFQ